MNQVITVGLDLAKHIFQLHGADSAGAVVFRKKLRRGQLLAFLATLPPCTVALEACGSAHDGSVAKLGAGRGSGGAGSRSGRDPKQGGDEGGLRWGNGPASRLGFRGFGGRPSN